jgi:hypothetical protein
MVFDPVLDESFARDCGMMLRMRLRDPRVSKAVQVAFVAMSALWLVNFSTQEMRPTGAGCVHFGQPYPTHLPRAQD